MPTGYQAVTISQWAGTMYKGIDHVFVFPRILSMSNCTSVMVTLPS